jgi:hypothetical protein
MRIELVYAPGCNTYRTALQILETVIAEERLPIPVELVENGHGHPIIRIDGKDVVNPGHNNDDHLRDSISRSWRELTAPAV